MITLIAILGALAALAALGLAYQALGELRDRRRLPPPGRWVEACGRRFHVHEMGDAAAPAVIFESGIAASSLNWRRMQTEASAFARAVAYDRAGLGWSEYTAEPRLASTVAAELRAVLEASGVRPPWILCGHSYGGLVARLFAARYPECVAALVLLDPLNPAEWRPLDTARARLIDRGVRLAGRGALLARFGVVRFALDILVAGGRVLPKLVARVTSSGDGTGEMTRLIGEVRKMPEEVWPAIRSHWCLKRSFSTMQSYFAMLPESVREMEHFGELPDVPVTLIVGVGSRTADPTLRARRLRMVVAEGAGHWVHLDRQDLVLAELRRAVEEAAAGGARA